MSPPQVSYVVALYNHERFIAALMGSIREQDFEDLEAIVVDDGSTDGSLQRAREAVGEDRRFRLLTQPNRGVVAARNRGLAEARGEFVSVVDSDDLLPGDRTRRLVEALQGRPGASMAYGDAWIIDADNRRQARFWEIYPPQPGDLSQALFLHYCFVPAVSVMVRRSPFEASGPFWGPGANTDYLKWIELGLFGEAVRLTGEPLGCWRWHGANVSQPLLSARIEQYHRLREGLAELLQRRPELAARLPERLVRRRYGRCHLMAGFYAGVEGQWAMARREFAASFNYERHWLASGAWISTWPPINRISQALYAGLARRRLRQPA